MTTNSSTKHGVPRAKVIFAVATGLVAIGAVVGAAIAIVVGGRQTEYRLPDFDTKLMAAAASGNEGFAMATGWVDENAEGVFLLDGLSGQLQCWVLNNRTGKFGAAFVANAMEDMQVTGKAPKFLLTTGEVDFRGSTGGRPGRSVAYVVETSTGKVAAYGVLWAGNRTAVNAVGRLQLLDVGTARTAAIRE